MIGGIFGDKGYGNIYLVTSSKRHNWLITWIILTFSPIVSTSDNRFSSAQFSSEAVDEVERDVILSTEDSKMSSDDDNGGTDLVRVEKAGENEIDSTIAGDYDRTGDGQMVMDGDKGSIDQGPQSGATAYPQAAYLEFTEWLERTLDEYGLEPSLYARCVVSILRQRPEPPTDIGLYHSQKESSRHLSIVCKNSSGKNTSAPPSRKNSYSSLAFASTLSPVGASVDHDTRKQALLDCLKTITSDKVELEKFVDDIVRLYTSACKQGIMGEKQNDSVDSGVCPSPEESFQNYDEAFPPLAADLHNEGFDAFFNETLSSLPRRTVTSCLNGKRPADATGKSDNEYDHVHQPELDTGDHWIHSDFDSGGQTCDDGSPVKRPKLNVLSEEERGGRSLRSCPDFILASEDIGGAATNTEKRATFCCPVVRMQQASHIGTTIAQPQFVIPKCWTVGSWPSRYYRSIKPARDVPFWSCSEWFCTLHKPLEFGLLNAKINGDAGSLAVPGIGKNGIGGQNDRIESIGALERTALDDGNVDLEIFEMEPVTPRIQLQHQHVQQQPFQPGRNANKVHNLAEQQPQIVPDMFDAPKFILRIINEDDPAMPDDHIALQNQHATNTVDTNDKTAPYLLDWTSAAPDGDASLQSETNSRCAYENGLFWTPATTCQKFSFSSLHEDGRVVPGSETIFPVDVSGLTNTDIGFCLPKCRRYPSINQQQLIVPTATTGRGATENRTVGNKACLFDQPKKLPQSIAVPVKESTHFIPIRSESMEDAYFLKPGFDEFCSMMDEMEGYYVYHQQAGIAVGATSGVNDPGKENVSGGSGRQRRSLKVKFRATNPDKMCQTEEQEPTYGGRACAAKGGIDQPVGTLLGECQRYNEQFEIWAYQNMDTDDVEVSPRCPEESCGAAEDTMFNGFAPFGEGWFDELVSGNCRTEAPEQAEFGDDQSSNRVIMVAHDALQATSMNDKQQEQQQRMELWQEEDDRYEDSLLRYVSSISLISPLDIPSSTTM